MQGNFKDLIHGKKYETGNGDLWLADVVNEPDQQKHDTDDLLFIIDFTGTVDSPGGGVRRLNLLTKASKFVNDEAAEIEKLDEAINSWLDEDEVSGKLDCRSL